MEFEIDFAADNADDFDFTRAMGHNVLEAFAVAVELFFSVFYDLVAAG